MERGGEQNQCGFVKRTKRNTIDENYTLVYLISTLLATSCSFVIVVSFFLVVAFTLSTVGHSCGGSICMDQGINNATCQHPVLVDWYQLISL